MGATTILSPLVWRGRSANPRPTAPEADTLTTRLSGPVNVYLIAHNFPTFPRILVKFVSKFMACKVVYFEALFN